MKPSQAIRIRRHLIALAKAFLKFHVVEHDTDGLPLDVDFDAVIAPGDPTPFVAPGTVLCNETASVFARDTTMGRKILDKRETWTFYLILQFNGEVALEAFEDLLTFNPPVLPRTTHLDTVILSLTNSSPEHPTTHQSSNGTRVIYTIVARLGKQ